MFACGAWEFRFQGWCRDVDCLINTRPRSDGRYRLSPHYRNRQLSGRTDADVRSDSDTSTLAPSPSTRRKCRASLALHPALVQGVMRRMDAGSVREARRNTPRLSADAGAIDALRFFAWPPLRLSTTSAQPSLQRLLVCRAERGRRVLRVIRRDRPSLHGGGCRTPQRGHRRRSFRHPLSRCGWRRR